MSRDYTKKDGVTPLQIRTLMVNFPERVRKDKAEREAYLLGFTGGRTGSTAELTAQEADALIYFLKNGEHISHAHYARFDHQNEQHRNVLRCCYDLGWTKWNKKAEKVTADLERLSAFIASKKCPVQKPLMQMTAQEVSKLIYVLEKL